MEGKVVPQAHVLLVCRREVEHRQSCLGLDLEGVPEGSSLWHVHAQNFAQFGENAIVQEIARPIAWPTRLKGRVAAFLSVVKVHPDSTVTIRNEAGLTFRSELFGSRIS
eukprot:1665125-Prymnesium_polylepis.2